MKVNKIIETRIDINNINDMFCSDYNNNILQILKKLYIKKCFKSIFILDIIRIVNRSGLHCKNKVLDGGTYIDISFEVSGIIYEKGEIIHNCKIIQINNNGTMHAKSDYASLNIKNVEGLVLVKENDIIPIIVHMSRCNIFEEEISVMAIPFIPILKQPIIYKINITSNSIDVLDLDVITKLENELQKIKKTNSSVYEFFIKLIYPFKSTKELDEYKGTKITLDNFAKLQQDMLIYSPESYLDNDTFVILSDEEKVKVMKLPDATTISINKNDYILYLCNQYTNRLNTLLEFLQLYDTPAKIKEKSQIWSVYTLLKK